MQWSGQSLVSQLSYRPKRLTQIDTRRTYLEPGEHNAAYLCAIAANAWANAAEAYTRIHLMLMILAVFIIVSPSVAFVVFFKMTHCV